MAGDTLHRKLIRDTVKSLLDGNTSAQTVNVYRRTEFFEAELSMINVMTPDDIPRITESHPTNFERNVRLQVEIMTRLTEDQNPEDEADKIAGEVEDILLPNIYLQNPPPKELQGVPYQDAVEPGDEIADNVKLGPVSSVKEEEGATDTFGIIAEYAVTYTYERKRGTVSPFEEGGVHYNLGGEQAVADQAEDLIELPQ